ncbi:MAG: exodeoxyribonuclease VII small subunit [Planctomycetota bacterium]|jgi:exodeoxyribonuclease VII small subunit
MPQADRPAPKETAETLESFEQAYARLETLVGRLEGGELGLDDALTSYEEGVRCLSSCHKILNAAERKLELLVQRPGGELVTETLDLDAMRQEARGEARIGGPAPAPSTPAPRADGPPRLARDSAPVAPAGPSAGPSEAVLPATVILESGTDPLDAESFYAEPEVLPAPAVAPPGPKPKRRKNKSTEGGSTSGERTLFGV